MSVPDILQFLFTGGLVDSCQHQLATHTKLVTASGDSAFCVLFIAN